MSERLDQKIRSAVTELVETSPPPHPAAQIDDSRRRRVSPLPLRSGLARMGAVAAAVLVVGLAGAWVGWNLGPPEVADTPDAPIVEGMLGPEPNFDPVSVFDAEEAPLTVWSGEVEPDVSTDTEFAVGTRTGNFKAVGGIPGTELEVFRWETDDDQTCHQVIHRELGESLQSTGCVDELTYGSDPYNPNRNSLGLSGMTDPRIDHAIVVWGVSEDTSVVVADTGEDVIWQRPRAAMVAFAFDTDIPSVSLRAYTADQELLAGGEFSPVGATGAAPPGETQVQGSAQDLVDIGESHPVNEILQAGVTDIEDFGEAAEDRGLIGACRGLNETDLPAFCLLEDGDTLIVVPLDGRPELTARISDPGLAQDVVISLDGQEPIGVRNLTGPNVEVAIEDNGVQVGALSTTMSSNNPEEN